MSSPKGNKDITRAPLCYIVTAMRNELIQAYIATIKDKIKCELCGKETAEYCHHLVCRECHKTETLEECLNNKQVNEILALSGFRPIER